MKKILLAIGITFIATLALARCVETWGPSSLVTGGIIIESNGDGTASSYSIPPQSTVTITTAHGYGSVALVDSSVSRSQTETDIDPVLAVEGVQ